MKHVEKRLRSRFALTVELMLNLNLNQITRLVTKNMTNTTKTLADIYKELEDLRVSLHAKNDAQTAYNKLSQERLIFYLNTLGYFYPNGTDYGIRTSSTPC